MRCVARVACWLLSCSAALSPALLRGQDHNTCGRIVVSRTASDPARTCLETLLGGDISAAIDSGVVTPGETIDFSAPAVNFVYRYQLWFTRRAAMIRAFGPSAPNVMLDVQELDRWNALREAWRDLDRAVERSRPKTR